MQAFSHWDKNKSKQKQQQNGEKSFLIKFNRKLNRLTLENVETKSVDECS